jgi:hypothetical protein
VDQPKIFMQENHRTFPFSEFQYWFDDMYQLYQIVMEPTHIGWPMYRDRAYVWGIRKDLSFSGSAEHFLLWSERIMSMQGDGLILASEPEYLEEVAHLAHNRMYQPPAAVPNGIAGWSKYMTLSMVDRMADHAANWNEKKAHESCYIADVDHNLNCGPVSRDGMVPSLVTHGMLVSFSKGTVVSSYNHLVFQGLPIYPDLATAAKYEVPFQELIDKRLLSGNAVKRLAGNAMCMPVMGVQLAYVLGHVHDSQCLPDLSSSGSSGMLDSSSSTVA